jgi:hypothetical protein
VKESDVIYLAGLIDGVGSFEVNVGPHDNYATGFRFEPMIRMQFKDSDTAVLGLLDEYCEEVGVNYSIQDRSNTTSLRFVVQDPDHICRFIEPMAPYLIRTYKDAEILCDKIAPKVKDGEHRTKQGIYDLMEYVEQLRAGSGRNPKYDREFFEKEWEGEISAE